MPSVRLLDAVAYSVSSLCYGGCPPHPSFRQACQFFNRLSRPCSSFKRPCTFLLANSIVASHFELAVITPTTNWRNKFEIKFLDNFHAVHCICLFDFRVSSYPQNLGRNNDTVMPTSCSQNLSAILEDPFLA